MALTGFETLQVLGQNPSGVPAASTFQTTTGAIAALASTEGAPFIVTNITTVGNGTLTAAGLVGGEIVRTGPTGVYSDTTDTAANIIAALPGAVVGSSFNILLKNATVFTQTIVAGTGVTLPMTVIIPAYSVSNYVATISTSSTITLVHIDTTPISIGSNSVAPSFVALSTVGAGTILATGFTAAFTTRSGAQAATAFTDTTDTAANIIAACANLVNKIGTSFIYTYQNTTNAPATITGGTGVTVSGITVVQANSAVSYLVTYTAAATLTMVGFSQMTGSTFGTVVANGVTPVTVANTAVSPNSQIMFTLKTVGGTVGQIPHAVTITPGTGFNVAATAVDTSTYNYEIRY